MKNTPELPVLSYNGFEQQKLSLHLFLQILGKIRLKSTPRKNHWWYITEYIGTDGLTTGPIPYDSGFNRFSITINVLKHLLDVRTSQGDFESFPLDKGLSVADFYNKLMGILKRLKIQVAIVDRPFDLGIDKPFGELSEYAHYDPEYTRDLWNILLWVDDIFKEFSGRFYGKTCPVHLYWHSMDLAVTRFSGKEAPPMGADTRISDKDAYTHECISFGFWAGDSNMPEPAFYSYTYPSPEGIEKRRLSPASAEWVENNGSFMAILRYADLLKENDPRQELLGFMETAYRAGAVLAEWDVVKFEVPALNDL